MELGTKVKRALAWSTLNNVAMRISSLALGILLARILSPAEFGVFAVAMTALTIVMALADLGMSADVIRHGVEGRAGTVTTLSLAVGGLLALGMSLSAGPVSAAMGSPQAAPVVRVMSLTLLLNGLSVVPYAKMQREFRQSAQMALDGINFVVSTLLTVALVFLGMGAMALAVSRLVGQAVATLLQFVLTRTRLRFGFDQEVARSLIRFGVPLAGANVLSWVVMNVGHMTIGATSGVVMLGLYTLAFNISTWPMSAMGLAIRAVALPAFALVETRERKAAGFVSAAALAWSGALLIGVLLSALAGVIVPLLYGERWSVAAQALAGLGFFGAFRVLLDLTATFLIAVGASRPVFIVQVAWLAALFPAVIAGVEWYGLAGAGWAHVLACTIVVLPLYAVVVHRHGVRLGVLTARLVVPAVAAVPAVLASLWVVATVPGTLLRLVLGGSVAMVVYAAPLTPWFIRRLAELGPVGRGQATVVASDSPPVAAAATLDTAR